MNSNPSKYLFRSMSRHVSTRRTNLTWKQKKKKSNRRYFVDKTKVVAKLFSSPLPSFCIKRYVREANGMYVLENSKKKRIALFQIRIHIRAYIISIISFRRKKIGRDLRIIFIFGVQSEFKIQRRMENYYYFLSTLSSQFPIRRKLKYFSTSEKRYRLFGKNSVRWGNWRCVDESGKRRYRWIGE